MIAIIGGGISGLTLAYHLQKQNKPYILLESNPVAGGYIQSERLPNGVIEKGPNSILADQFVLDFIKELGLKHSLVKANSISKKRFVYKEGKYRSLPSGPLSLLFSSYFSFSQRLKILSEFFNTQQADKNATLYDLVNNRFGNEAADYALDPFVSGVYAGSSKELLADLCFPILQENINRYGSILKGFIKNPPQRKTSVTFQKGLQELTNTLSSKLTNIRYQTEVTSLEKENSTWKLNMSTTEGTEQLHCDQVVLAIPAFKASTLFSSFSKDWSARFAAVPYPTVYNAHFIFKNEQLKVKAEGFGALHPSIEPLFTAGVIWNSSVFNNRTDKDHTLFTCMVTEKRTPSLLQMKPDDVADKILTEIKQLYKISGDPVYKRLGVWEKAIPQYTLAMRSILENCKDLEKMNVYICSNWPKGISINDCIHNAYELSTQLK